MNAADTDLCEGPREGAGARGEGAFARDLLVVHFHDSHRETFAAARRRLGATAGDGEVRQAVEGAVRLIFRGLDADFADPSRDELLRVAHALARKAAAWGTAPEVVQGQLHRMLSAIDQACRPSSAGSHPASLPEHVSC